MPLQRPLARRLGGLLSLAALAGLAGVTGCGTVASTKAREAGDTAYGAGDYQAAVTSYAEAADANPSDVRAHWGLGQSLLAVDRPVPAELAFRDGLAVARDDTFWRLRLTDGLAEAISRQPGQEDALFEMLQDSVDRFGTAADGVRQGLYLQRIGDSDNALAALEQAAGAAEPGDATALVALGDFYRALGDDELARSAYRWAYWVNDRHPDLPRKLEQVGYFPGPTAALAPPEHLRPSE